MKVCFLPNADILDYGNDKNIEKLKKGVEIKLENLKNIGFQF